MNEKPFPALERERSLSERVAESILERIVSGELMPGDRLPSERDLGEQFGVSRTVVREAVRSLTGRGVVSVRPGSGLRVVAIEPTAVQESLTLLLRGDGDLDYHYVHEVRAMLEVHAAGAASERATPEDVATMQKARVAMERARGVEASARHDLEFHRRIAASTHNPLYLMLHDVIGDQLMEVRRSNLGQGGRDEALTSHRRIIDCIANHDRVGAEQAMREHLEAVEQIWRASDR